MKYSLNHDLSVDAKTLLKLYCVFLSASYLELITYALVAFSDGKTLVPHSINIPCVNNPLL